MKKKNTRTKKRDITMWMDNDSLKVTTILWFFLFFEFNFVKLNINHVSGHRGIFISRQSKQLLNPISNNFNVK